jgi:hypothetical protein
MTHSDGIVEGEKKTPTVDKSSFKSVKDMMRDNLLLKNTLKKMPDNDSTHKQ